MHQNSIRRSHRPLPWSSAGSLIILATISDAAAAATVLKVCKQGCTYATIQSAVNAAKSGDQISVAEGIYTENVTINGKTLVLDGAGSDLTSVDGSGAAAPVFALGAPAHTGWHEVTLRNMTITHGTAPAGGGVLVQEGAYLKLRSSAVINNVAFSASGGSVGGGIEIDTFNGPASSIVDSRIEANTNDLPNNPKDHSRGGGIHVEGGSTLIISDSEIRGNSTREAGGGLESENGSHVTITTSSFDGNSANGFFFLGVGQGCGGAIAASSDISISNSTIAGNFADLGGGVCVTVGTATAKQALTIAKTTIARNTAGGGQEDVGPLGAGIAAFSSSTTRVSTLLLDHVYLSQNENITTNSFDDEIATAGEIKVAFKDTTIGDPTDSGCIGAACGK
jgi:hypothetical protein